MTLLLLAACAPEDADVAVPEPEPCGEGFARADDGNCYELGGGDDSGDDTAVEDTGTDETGDSDTAPEDSDTAVEDTQVEDTAPPDTDADDDGTDDAEDCAPTDPTIHPGADDDTDDDVDNDCDGTADEDYDPCAASWGSAVLSTTSYASTSEGRFTAGLSGEAWVCEVSCDATWLVVDLVSDDACRSSVAPPYSMSRSDTLKLCVTVYDAGPRSTGHCTARTSAGDKVVEVTWEG